MIFKQRLGQCFFEWRCLAAKVLNVLGVRLSCGITGQTLLASLQKLLRPTVVQILVNTFFAAQLRNAVLASQTFQYDPDLLFG